jgi:hypothetical protein
LGQEVAPVASGSATEPEHIIVTGHREVPGIRAERRLGQSDIEAYGVGSIGELIDELATENGDSGDETVFLVDGRRISGIEELSDYPPEALERVDVLPVGAGAHIGAPAAKRVYNLILQRSFVGKIATAAGRAATEGGWASRSAEANYTRIREQRRVNVKIGVRDEDSLLESERDVRQPGGALAEAGRYRTLAPDRLGLELGISGAAPLTDWVDFSASGKLSLNRARSLLGVFSEFSGAREQNRHSAAGKLNATLNAQRRGWDVTVLGRYEQDWRRARYETDAFATALNRSVGLSRSGEFGFSAARSLFQLPAGTFQVSLGGNLAADRTVSQVQRSDGPSRVGNTERSSSLLGGFVLPVTSPSGNLLPFIGELNLAANFGITRFSSLGRAANRHLSLTWQPAAAVRLSGTLSRNTAPPAARFRREPLLVTPGVRYFDPLRNETVDVTEVTGGVATFARQASVQRQLGVSLSPPGPLSVRLNADYAYRRDRNLLSALPQASPFVFALFPERFLRDSAGRLTSVDARPVLFAGRTERELRTAINFLVPLAVRRDKDDAEAADDQQDGEERERSGPKPRLQFNLAHTYLLSSKLLTAGGTTIDLLSRRAIAFGGGRPRHQLDGSIRYSERGLGLRLTGSHQSRSFVELGGGPNNPDLLQFGALTIVNLRAFANADRLFGSQAWARGSRVSLSLMNLANARQVVRDSFGVTPLAFQPAYRDAVGRTVEVELRRKF